MTLGRWFLVWMLIVMVLVLALSLAVVTVRGHAVLSEQLIDRATAVARSLAWAVDEPAAGAAALAALPECVAVAVEENGSTVWGYGPEPAQAVTLDPSLVTVSQVVVVPDSGGERVLEVTLALSLATVRTQVVDTSARLAIALTLTLGLTLVAGVLLVNRAVEPIKDLTERVRAFHPDRPMEPLVAAGAAEVRELGASFNAMAQRLIEQRRSLVESEGRFRELFLASPTALLEVDEGLAIRGANPVARSLLGDGSELEGRLLADFLDPSSAARVADATAGAGLESGGIEGRWRLAGGEDIAVDLLLRPVGAGSDSAWLVAVHDLSDRLRRMGEQWHHTFDEMTDGVALLDGGGRVVLANRAIQPVLEPLLGQVVARLEGRGRQEWQVVHGDRTLRCLLLSPESFERRILVVRDDTDWLRAEERLREAHKMAAVATLAGGVAHDFNNLLAGILLQVRLLERSSETREEAAAAIRTLAEEGAAVVRGLIQFAQPEVTPLAALDLAAVVAEQEPLLRHLMPPSIEVSTELATAWVEGRRSDLRRVVLNLVINARAALAESGGRVRVRVAEAGGAAVLEVEDTGPGVAVEDRERIFEPFFSGRRDGRGAGLGLAVVYAVVREHGGEVTVGEAPGGGARFTVRLPARSPAMADADGTAEAPPEACDGHGERVLVVDDEQLIAARLAEELALVGYEVRCADSVRSAWEVCAGWRPDVLVLDLLLPDGNGRDLALDLRAELGPLPVLFASGNVEEHGPDVAAVEASMILAKPFPVERLVAGLGALLGAGPRSGEGSST